MIIRSEKSWLRLPDTQFLHKIKFKAKRIAAQDLREVRMKWLNLKMSLSLSLSLTHSLTHSHSLSFFLSLSYVIHVLYYFFLSLSITRFVIRFIYTLCNLFLNNSYFLYRYNICCLSKWDARRRLCQKKTAKK
jgi:hypothetical protein